MKSSKESGLHKIVSFALIAVLLVFIVGFAANGWNEDLKGSESGDGGDKTGETDENIDNNPTPPDDDTSNTTPPPSTDSTESEDNNSGENTLPPEPEAPKYINSLTGLEITKEQSEKLPLGFVINPSLAMYGVSSSDLAIEFPTEDGTTRMLSYTTDTSLLWKIGSLVETRAFISGMSNFFGGIVVSYGNDDIVKYSPWDLSKSELNLKNFTSCYYTENTLYVYTSAESVDMALSQRPDIKIQGYKNAPYIFNQDGKVLGNNDATTVIIPYSESSETELYYSEKTGKYLYYKSGNRKIDMLSGKNISFNNVFILFADTTTYDKSIGSELVVDTTSGGRGYYISAGKQTEITWSVNENAELKFFSLSGDVLEVNTGNSYISYYKASNSSAVKIN